MNHSDNFYVKMGTLLCTYAAMASVTYRAVYLYIYHDLPKDWQRERMTRDFLHLFHGDE